VALWDLVLTQYQSVVLQNCKSRASIVVLRWLRSLNLQPYKVFLWAILLQSMRKASKLWYPILQLIEEIQIISCRNIYDEVGTHIGPTRLRRPDNFIDTA